MTKLSISMLKGLSTAAIVKQLPITVVSGKKEVFKVVSLQDLPTTPLTQYTDDQLVKLLIGNDSDTVHIADAKKRISVWKGGMSPVTPAPTIPTTPTTPTSPTIPKSDEQFDTPHWLGEWSGNVKDAVAGYVKDAGAKTALLVAYNIPGRDNGNYSAGGLHSASEYATWIKSLADGIGSAKAVVILEPDALGLSRLLSDQAKNERYTMLSDAVKTLKANKNTRVYVDSSTWAGVDDSANLLNKVPGVDGFSCNVSGYESQSACIEYGNAVAAKTGLHYVIDTSRNGNGNPHPGKWCNVTDTKIGIASTTQTGIEKCDAFLWVKVPGESDGLKINGSDGDGRPEVAPSAGTMWPEFRDAIYSGDWTAFKKKYNV